MAFRLLMYVIHKISGRLFSLLYIVKKGYFARLAWVRTQTWLGVARTGLLLVLLWGQAGGEKAYGQSIFSPYTALGIGEPLGDLTAIHASMAFTGIGLPRQGVAQRLQIAKIAQERLTHIYLGMMADIRTTQGAQSSASNREFSFGGLFISFPILVNRLGVQVGISPYSALKYGNAFQLDREINGQNVSSLHRLEGNGGLYRAELSAGLRLFKGLYLGVGGKFYRGIIHRSERLEVLESASGLGIAYREKESYLGFNVETALYYEWVFKKGTKSEANPEEAFLDDHKLGIGITFTPSLSLDRKYHLDFQRYNTITSFGITPPLTRRSESSAYRLPNTLGFGLGYQGGLRWLVAADATYTQEPIETIYRSRWRVALGAGLVPNPRSFSYLGHISYRMGLSWEQLPYASVQEGIGDLSVYLGMRLPLKANDLYWAVRLGWRGQENAGAYRENYVQIYLGTVLNPRWFLKRKYD